jgi:hypothetical protein
MSGVGKTETNWTGVGFIIAPWCARFVAGFLQYSDRIASLKLKVSRGFIAIFSIYAPHNLKPLDERFNFYCELGRLFEKWSGNGNRYLFGKFNARIGRRRRGEEDVLGAYGFGREAIHAVEVPNRDLLMEFCIDFGYVLGNTLHPDVDNDKATYFEPGSTAMSQVTEVTHNMLDLALVPSEATSETICIHSMREAALMTDHFLVCCHLDFRRKASIQPKRRMKDRAALIQRCTRQTFVSTFKEELEKSSHDQASVAARWQNVKKAFNAAEGTLPEKTMVPNKPWIRAGTIELISQRAAAQEANHADEMRILHKKVRRSAKDDRAAWIDASIADGRGMPSRSFGSPYYLSKGA